MNRNHVGCIRGFHHLSKAWYGPANLKNSEVIDEITLGLYHPDGGTSGEMSIRWSDLGGKSVPRLVVFNDAWSALAQFKDVIKTLAAWDSDDTTPSEVAAVLTECGFTDLTAVDSPYPDTPRGLRVEDRPSRSR